MSDLSAALRQCEADIGAANVLCDAESLARCTRNASGLERAVVAVLKPATTAEVQSLVRTANRFQLPLYPISRGRNWGMGSRLPVRDGCAVLDLSRLNRIHDISDEFLYAVIEPGVTQGQLSDELVKRRIPAILNVTGSSRDSSVLGNSLDRGIGYFSTRANGLSGLEVVLGTGEILRTGFAHYEASKTTHYYKHGLGPGLDGLFFQSNLGIVTRAGVDLLPWKEGHESAIIKIDDTRLLGRLVEAMADLRRREIVRMIVHIGNRARTIGTLAPLVYRTLPPALKPNPATGRKNAEDILLKEGFGQWSAIAGFSGTPDQRRAVKKAILARVRNFAKVTFLSDAKIATARKILDRLSFLPSARTKRMILDAMEPIYGLSSGVPTDAALPSAYWACGEVVESLDGLDPDQSVCGMLYSAPMVPLSAESGVESAEFVHAILSKYGIVPMTTLNLVDERCLELVITIPFRRDIPERVEAAHRCLEELQKGWIERGCYPYRLGVQEMGLVVREKDCFWETVKSLKAVFDPNHIIAPGRYNLI